MTKISDEKNWDRYNLQRARRAFKILNQFGDVVKQTMEYDTLKKVIDANPVKGNKAKNFEAKKDDSSSDESEGEEEVGGDAHVSKFDFEDKLFPGQKLREYIIQIYKNRNSERTKPLTIQTEFMITLNRQFFKWIQDILDYIPLAAQADLTLENKKSSQNCDSKILSEITLMAAVKLMHAEIPLDANVDDVPQPKEKTLIRAMKYYAYPMDRITKGALETMTYVIRLRLRALVEEIIRSAIAKKHENLTVCPKLSNGAKVRAAKPKKLSAKTESMMALFENVNLDSNDDMQEKSESSSESDSDSSEDEGSTVHFEGSESDSEDDF